MQVKKKPPPPPPPPKKSNTKNNNKPVHPLNAVIQSTEDANNPFFMETPSSEDFFTSLNQ